MKLQAKTWRAIWTLATLVGCLQILWTWSEQSLGATAGEMLVQTITGAVLSGVVAVAAMLLLCVVGKGWRWIFDGPEEKA